MSNKYCPLCKKTNDCMVNSKEGNCWCYGEEFSKEIFHLVPNESRRKHCICKECLDQFRTEQKSKE
nr:cysteine-rich CWC family protein [Lysinibacillus timonensis]